MDLNELQETPPWEWPGDAGRTFRKTLNNRNAPPADRLIAAELAGDITVVDNDMANVLLTVLKSPDEPEELRARAAIALGPALELAYTDFDEELDGFDDPDMVPISEGQYKTIQDRLQRMYNDAATPKEVRRRILEAAVRSPQPWQQDAVREAYASGDHEWMLTAVFAMHEIPGFEGEILESLANPDPEIHLEAVRAAGARELDEAWTHVLSLIVDSSTEKDLRLAAIEAIGDIRPSEAKPILLELSDSEDEDIAAAADEALSFIIDSDGNDYEDEDDEDD